NTNGEIGDLAITLSLGLRSTNRQNQWNQDDETDVSRQNTVATSRLSLSFQLEVVGEPSLEQQLGGVGAWI
ncbi:hypothetical protein LINPERPRIM_LOCUS21060, partial [Linum perenne]